MRFMAWKTIGAELPATWTAAVSAHNKSLVGRRGLGRYAWCVAAEFLLCLPVERLREMASKHREHAERDWDSFNEKWATPEQAIELVRAEFLELLQEILESGRVENHADSEQTSGNKEGRRSPKGQKKGTAAKKKPTRAKESKTKKKSK